MIENIILFGLGTDTIKTAARKVFLSVGRLVSYVS